MRHKLKADRLRRASKHAADFKDARAPGCVGIRLASKETVGKRTAQVRTHLGLLASDPPQEADARPLTCCHRKINASNLAAINSHGG